LKTARVVVVSIALLLPMLVQAQRRGLSPGSVFAPNNAEAADALDAGTAAFRDGDYATAKSSFEKVVTVAPSLAVGHLYLGTVYSMLMDESEHGKAYGTSAIREFKIYLNSKPFDRSALVMLGEVYWKQGADEDALKCYRTAEQQESGWDSAYAIGSINRAMCQNAMFGKKEMLNVDDMPSLVTEQSCPKFRNEYLRNINEGIDYTQVALRLKPDDANTMLEMMLLFEFRSRLACGNRQAQKNDHEQSLMWRQKLEQRFPDKQQKE
jgi:tetratricopeptide (TPR) repeat protein